MCFSIVLLSYSLILPGISKLRRVLLAYSLHNPDIEYCQVKKRLSYNSKSWCLLNLFSKFQGFNRIAAIGLLFLNEEDAFWLLVYIVDVVMPLNYYTKQLIGAQVDQAVFKELVMEKLPNLAEHLGDTFIWSETKPECLTDSFIMACCFFAISCFRNLKLSSIAILPFDAAF